MVNGKNLREDYVKHKEYFTFPLPLEDSRNPTGKGEEKRMEKQKIMGIRGNEREGDGEEE